MEILTKPAALNFVAVNTIERTVNGTLCRYLEGRMYRVTPENIGMAAAEIAAGNLAPACAGHGGEIIPMDPENCVLAINPQGPAALLNVRD